MDDCPTGILVDLSEPIAATLTLSPLSLEEEDEDKENVIPLTDSIEIERSADTERRLSLTLKNSDDIQGRILCDITEQALLNSAKTCASPGLKLIDDETFDFDLAMSPAIRIEENAKDEDDDDEVFFGPVCFNERLKQTAMQEEVIPPLSPLNAEQFAKMVKEANYVAYRIKNSKASSGDESSPRVKSADEENTPASRRHNRSGTFTKCKSPLELLPEDVRRFLPVIDDSRNKPACDSKELTVNDPNNLNSQPKQGPQKTTSSQVSSVASKPSTGKRLMPPSKLQTSKLVRPSLKYGSSCESLDGRDSRTCDQDSDTNCSVTSDCSDTQSQGKVSSKTQNGVKTGVVKKSKLMMPGANRSNSLNCSLNSSVNDGKRTVKPSRLAGPKTGANTSINVSTPNRAPPRVNGSTVTKSKDTGKSVEPARRSSPRLKAKQEEVTKKAPNMKGPITKLSLMKPGDLQKRLQKPTTTAEKGPLKAVQPVENLDCSINKKQDTSQVQPSRSSSTSCVSTPVKQDKRVKPTLLANNFTTPSTSRSSSTSTPMSARRKSFLPTPQKSFSSIPGSPMTSRPSSTSSRLSQMSSCSSVSDSPVFVNRPHIVSASKSTTKFSNSSDVSDHSMKAGRPGVVHTPQLPQKVQSKWSPIRRAKPISRDEEVIKCTKRKL